MSDQEFYEFKPLLEKFCKEFEIPCPGTPAEYEDALLKAAARESLPLKSRRKIAAQQILKRKIAAQPKIKRQLVIERCENPNALEISIGSDLAAEWIKSEGARYAKSDTWDLITAPRFAEPLPINITLTVSKCYDISEVKAYLESYED